MPLLPESPTKYYEPFLGGGALFFALQPKRAFLSDTNADLINLYTQVRDNPDKLMKVLKTFKNSERFYYQVRDQSPRNPLFRAARLLYLTTLSFNGIHRVNLRGEFNVPYGYKAHLDTCDEAKIVAASEALQHADLRVADFEQATRRARKGALIYFDPPYTVAHAHNGFLKYNEKIFSWDDQKRLADHARHLAARGCHIVISNADHSSVAGLYRGFNVTTIDRYSKIAASAEFRRKITETIYYLPGS